MGVGQYIMSDISQRLPQRDMSHLIICNNLITENKNCIMVQLKKYRAFHYLECLQKYNKEREKTKMKKTVKHIISLIMVAIMLITLTEPAVVEASNTKDKYGNLVADMQSRSWNQSIKIGDEIYYTQNHEPYEGIYKINKNGTKSELVYKLNGGISHFSRYGKWLYFIWDKDGGGIRCSLTNDSWLCKVKLEGTGFKVICRSNSCMIRNNMLYYQKTKHGYDKWGEHIVDIDTGKIGKINLKTGKKSTFKGKNIHLVAVEKNKIYYYKPTKQDSILYSMNANGKAQKKLKKVKGAWVIEGIIYNNSLYWKSGSKLYKKSFKRGKTRKICSVKGLDIYDIKNGKIYAKTMKKVYTISMKTGKKTCILKSSNSIYGAKVYGNLIIVYEWLKKDYTNKNGKLYNTRLYSYNIKTKKKVTLIKYYEQ